MPKLDWSEVVIIAVVAILLFIVIAFKASAQDFIEGDLTRLDIVVTDGDTFKIRNPTKLAGTLNIEKHQNRIGELAIRIQGIDAPEKKQACYRLNGESFDCAGAATKELARQLQGSKLYCVKSSTSYTRVVMRCSVDDRSVGVNMVMEGYAFFDPNPRYTSGVYRAQLWAAETYAKVGRVGVWDQAEVEKPWVWRKEQER